MTLESATITIEKTSKVVPDTLASIRSRFPSIIRHFPAHELELILADFPITKARMAEDIASLRQVGDMTAEPIEIVINNLIQDGRSSDYSLVVESHRLYVNLAHEVPKRTSGILYSEEGGCSTKNRPRFSWLDSWCNSGRTHQSWRR